MPARKPSPSLSGSDIRLLRIFQAVVRQQGFAAAQADLGLTPATISNHIAHLEARLGVRLCNRGRKGFSLTSEGARVHEASLNLLRSAENFSSIIGPVPTATAVRSPCSSTTSRGIIAEPGIAM